jgi:transcriptional regulator with XRE-family HTH domain
MTPAQCRAARALLALTREQLAQQAGVSRAAIAEYEAGSGHSTALIGSALGQALEAAGVSFIDGDEPGVKLKRRGPPDEGLRPDQLTTENDD